MYAISAAIGLAYYVTLHYSRVNEAKDSDDPSTAWPRWSIEHAGLESQN